MYPEIKTFLYEAEHHYLQPEEIENCKHHLASLHERLATYELLRDKELAIFQPIADRLLQTFPQEQQTSLEQVLKRWLAVMRYCAMAMLLDNPEFLQRRLLEWLTDIVQVQQTQDLDRSLYQLLATQLQTMLAEEQLALVQPFLAQAEDTLLGTGNLAKLPG